MPTMHSQHLSPFEQMIWANSYALAFDRSRDATYAVSAADKAITNYRMVWHASDFKHYARDHRTGG
jgi:hypothetical protein